MQRAPGDVLDAREQLVAHACNCVSEYAHAGAARLLFARWPAADDYARRRPPAGTRPRAGPSWATRVGTPGTVAVHAPAGAPFAVANMFAQYYPDAVAQPCHRGRDSAAQRQDWLAACLAQIAALPDVRSVALPAGLGADWPDADHLPALAAWAQQHAGRLTVVLYGAGAAPPPRPPSIAVARDSDDDDAG